MDVPDSDLVRVTAFPDFCPLNPCLWDHAAFHVTARPAANTATRKSKASGFPLNAGSITYLPKLNMYPRSPPRNAPTMNAGMMRTRRSEIVLPGGVKNSTIAQIIAPINIAGATIPCVRMTVWCKITNCGLERRDTSNRNVPNRATITAPRDQLGLFHLFPEPLFFAEFFFMRFPPQTGRNGNPS